MDSKKQNMWQRALSLLRICTIAMVLSVAITLCIWFDVSAVFSSTKAGHVHALVTSSLSIASSTPSANSHPSNGAVSGIDWANPTILAAFIALMGVFIASAFSFYQHRRTVKFEREKSETQFQYQQQILELQKKLEEQYKEKDREQQRREMDAEAVRLSMLHATTLRDRDKAYRDFVRADPRIARLQILDMSRPLDVMRVYVRLWLHEETRLEYELNPALREAEIEKDPNALLRASRMYLENRTSAALDPHEAIRNYKHCVIVGDPGAGKTTLLKYLTLQAINGNLAKLPDLPILIELDGYANSDSKDLLDYASKRWNIRYDFPEDEARAYMEERLKAGDALLLLDGLDETMLGETAEIAENSYRHVSSAISNLRSLYHKSPIVVTVRKAAYQQRTQLEGFTELEVLDFRLQDIELFVTNWFSHDSNLRKQSNATDLITKLEQTPRIQALAANPLLLSLIVIVYEEHLDLPDRRAKLYEQCVEILLSRWDASRNIHRRREFKPEHKQQLLEEVAWHFHKQGRRYFPENELLEVVANFLPAVNLPAAQNRQVLAEIVAGHGLLKEQARGWYGFLHLTLQEYFVAQHAADQGELDVLLRHVSDPWWIEVILLYAGRIGDASSFLQRLIEMNTEAALAIAGRTLAARPTIRQQSLREQIIVHLFDQLQITSYQNKDKITDALVEIGGKDVNARLLQALSDENIVPIVRKSIADSLGRQDGRAIAADLVPLLFNEQITPIVRQNIADALGKLVEQSIPSAIPTLLSSPQLDPHIRETIAAVLGEQGESSMASALSTLLSDENLDLDVRQSIVVVLYKIGQSSAISALLTLLSNEKLDPDIRQSVAVILGRLSKPSIVPALHTLLSNPHLDPKVHGSIAAVLSQMNDHP